MTDPSGVRRSMPTLGIALLIIAGVLFIVGTFVPAATVKVQGQSESAALWDGWEGKASLILGIVLLGAALWAMRGRAMGAGGLLAVLIGVAGTALALWKIFTIESEAVDRLAEATAGQQGVPVEAARPAVQQLFDSGAASVSVAIGLYLVVIAGVLTIVGGIVLAMRRRSAPTVAMPERRAA